MIQYSTTAIAHRMADDRLSLLRQVLAERAQARVAVALGAYDRVFGGDGSAEAVGPSGGAGLGVGE